MEFGNWKLFSYLNKLFILFFFHLWAEWMLDQAQELLLESALLTGDETCWQLRRRTKKTIYFFFIVIQKLISSLLFLTLRILRAPDGLSILVKDQVTFVRHGQTHLVGVLCIPGNRGPHGFPLLGVHNQVVVRLEQNSDSLIVSRVGMPAWRPPVDDEIAVLLWLVEIK